MLHVSSICLHYDMPDIFKHYWNNISKIVHQQSAITKILLTDPREDLEIMGICVKLFPC